MTLDRRRSRLRAMADVHRVWAAVRGFASSRLADWLLAGAFALAAEVDVLLTMPGPSWPQAVTAMRGLGVLSLGYRRRSPLLVMALLCGLELAVAAIVKDPEIGAWATLSTIPVFVVSYSLGAYASPRALLLGLPLPLITAAVADTLWPGEHSVAEALPFVGLFLVGLPALAGWVVRGRSRLVGHLKEQTAELEAERATRAGRALVEERLRISSELHHVVSSTIQGLLTQIAAGRVDDGDGQVSRGLQPAVHARAGG